MLTLIQFLSTLSLRRATQYSRPRSQKAPYFYPRSPCGERPGSVISGSRYRHFYPRSPCGERRACLSACVVGASISIHALLAESDFSTSERLFIPSHYFYPRSPCGERLSVFWMAPNRPLFLSTLSLRRATFNPFETLVVLPFLSTLSLRRATGGERANQSEHCISIHALLAESDVFLTLTVCNVPIISIHALLAESDVLQS